MPLFDNSVNVLWLPFLFFISAALGYALRSSRIKKANMKIISLENEMLKNHAEILNLQKEIVRLQAAQQNSKTPVVHLKDAPPPSSEEKGGLKERK